MELWYLSHSQFYNERTVPIIMLGSIAHARNGRMSTSGLKSDVTIVFLDPDLWRYSQGITPSKGLKVNNSLTNNQP